MDNFNHFSLQKASVPTKFLHIWGDLFKWHLLCTNFFCQCTLLFYRRRPPFSVLHFYVKMPKIAIFWHFYGPNQPAKKESKWLFKHKFNHFISQKNKMGLIPLPERHGFSHFIPPTSAGKLLLMSLSFPPNTTWCFSLKGWKVAKSLSRAIFHTVTRRLTLQEFQCLIFRI